MKVKLLPAIALAALGAGCAYDPTDGAMQTSSTCVTSASQYGPSCGAEEASQYVLQRERRGAQYYANLRTRQSPSATASIPTTQTSE